MRLLKYLNPPFHFGTEELSRKTEIPQSYISRLINGNMILSRPRLTLIAEVLDKSVAELFGE